MDRVLSRGLVGVCAALRRGSNYQLVAGKTYRLEIGPLATLAALRILVDGPE